MQKMRDGGLENETGYRYCDDDTRRGRSGCRHCDGDSEHRKCGTGEKISGLTKAADESGAHAGRQAFRPDFSGLRLRSGPVRRFGPFRKFPLFYI